MKNINDILKVKGGSIWSVSPGTTAYEALELMADKDIGALLVLDDGKLVGIFSERDYARKVILKGKASKDTAVSELMTQAVLYVKPENTLSECLALMTSKHIRHLPVIDSHRIVGVITIGDVVKGIISEHEITISSLETYISGGY
ncbi:MAG: CBS domain-containing protein [Nitrospirae bacterium]|nr:CBS domain-containing protein [Nitrospirota bacterium]